MQSLTKDAEQKIQAAIEQLCRESDSMSSASIKEAAVKMARKHQFQPDMIRLMCLGYNNGMATFMREQNDSILEKVAEFPLLDAGEVVSEIYTKSAAAAPPPVAAAAGRFTSSRRPINPAV